MSKRRRMRGCQSLNHSECYGELWQCTQCGKSIKGHEGSCGGTKVDDIGDQKACEGAGGAWITEAEAAKYKM